MQGGLAATEGEMAAEARTAAAAKAEARTAAATKAGARTAAAAKAEGRTAAAKAAAKAEATDLSFPAKTSPRFACVKLGRCCC